MNKSEGLKELGAALAKAQADFPAIPRNREVTVRSDKGNYKFRYAPFEDILRATKPVLARHGLAYSQGEQDGVLQTVIIHASGEWLQHASKINPGSGSAQAYGSALTYARRYGFCAAFGIQADDDDDGNAADGNQIEHSENLPPRGSAAEVKKDAFEVMNADEQNFLRKIAADVIALLDEGRDPEAYGYLRNQKLVTEEQVAIQHLFSSKQRSTLAKEGEQFRLQQKASAKAAA